MNFRFEVVRLANYVDGIVNFSSDTRIAYAPFLFGKYPMKIPLIYL